MSDEQLAAFDDAFKALIINWGRSCQAALGRVCQFHVDLGMELPPDLRCRPAVLPNRD